MKQKTGELKILKNIDELLSLAGAAHKQGRHTTEADLSLSKKQAVVFAGGRILWVGPTQKIPKEYARVKKSCEWNMNGKTVLPGFVECHTHTLFAGDRSHEFEMRNQGVSYQEIAARGGGIIATMKPTRESSEKSLRDLAQRRIENFQAQGVTTLEVKSGYALDLKGELKLLKVAHQLKGVRVVPTFLGPHARPPEFKTAREYLDFLSEKVLPEVYKKKLSRRVDIFIEKNFFEKKESLDYLKKAQSLGFDLVIHADQLSLCGGAETAVELKAVSADHLLQISDSEISKLARSEVTCVLLPAADLYMKTKYPAARELIDKGARIALATDYNPGSSPTQDLSLVGVLARLQMKMSLHEVIAAYTVGASYALRLQNEVGSIEVGKSADFMCTDFSWTNLFYSIGARPAVNTFVQGQLSYSNR